MVDAKSGVSGAGRGGSVELNFSEVNENFKAYALDGHRHHPEIIQELGELDGNDDLRLTFLTHLVPMTRGILVSCYAPIKEGAIPDGEAGRDRVREIYEDYYQGEPFTKVVPAPPQTKHTSGNNDCVVYPTIDLRANRLIAIACLDNLVKGAAGGGVQNMNVHVRLRRDRRPGATRALSLIGNNRTALKTKRPHAINTGVFYQIARA